MLGAFAPAAAQDDAKDYPSRTIRIVVPFPAGGPADLAARIIAQKMSENIGQQVLVDNRPGAGGNISAELLAKAPPDGYTILACTTGMFAIQPFLYKNLPYNPEREIGRAHV